MLARRHLACFALLVAALSLSACASYRIRQPAAVVTPATAHVLDYGHHASLALEQADGTATEWFWGDWDWFALGRRGVFDGMEALFASQGSALGRRTLQGGPDRLRQATGATVLTLQVDRGRSDALQRQLEQRFARAGGDRARHPDGREFVRERTRYSLSNNSVHELVRWLRQLGVDVRGGGPTARFRLEPGGAQTRPRPPPGR